MTKLALSMMHGQLKGALAQSYQSKHDTRNRVYNVYRLVVPTCLKSL